MTSLGTKLQEEHENLRRRGYTEEMNTWSRVKPLRNLLLKYAKATTDQDDVFSPYTIKSSNLKKCVKCKKPDWDDPFNPLQWGGELKELFDKYEVQLRYYGKNSDEIRDILKIANVYSTCLTICMNYEMSYGKRLFLVDGKYDYSVRLMSDLLVEPENMPEEVADIKKIDIYPSTLFSWVEEREKRRTDKFGPDVKMRKRPTTFLSKPFLSKKDGGELDLTNQNQRTVWVAAIFVEKVIKYESTIAYSVEELNDFISRMAKVLEYYVSSKNRTAAIDSINRHPWNINLKF